MNKKLKLLIDMDGVIVNLMDPWLERINKKFDTSFTREDIKGGIAESTGISEDQCCSFFYEKDFWLDLPVQDDVLDYLPKLDKLYDIIIVTKAHFEAPFCAHEKYKWMHKHFGTEFKMVQTKYKSYIRGSIIIDDMYDNLLHCHQRGKMTIAYAQPWNTNVDFCIRAKNWEHIYDILRERTK